MPSTFLTFDRMVFPEEVHCALYQLTTKACVPNPHRCFYCNSFGDIARSSWRFQSGLPSCSGLCHGGDYPDPYKYYHCEEAHTTSSKDCDGYKYE